MHSKRIYVFIVLSLLFAPLPALAQTQSPSADLYPPDVSAFPSVSALLDVYDSNRVFVSGLRPEAVTVMEDGNPIPASELTEMAVPLQLVVAVNPGPPLDVRDSQGLSKYQRLTQVLSAWAQARPPDLPDDISLVSLSGPVIAHSNANDFRASLNSFQPDFRASVPNLQSLSIAIDTVSAQTPRSGMKRAILFITPHMDDPNIDSAIMPYIERAIQNRIRVFVWFVDLDSYFVTTSAAAFNMLAMQSGGSMFGYSGVEQFPDPEAYFSPLRRVYALKYNSQLTTGGQHTFNVRVNLPSGVANSPDQTFNVDIQPPNPILVNPPLQITRQAPPEDPFNTELLLPEKQNIEIIIEFPDQHKRPLVRTTLYVDGQIVDENTQQPFEQFTWDLTGYNLSGQHTLIVEAADSLGLSKASMGIPVTVTVIQPPRGVTAFFAKYRLQITIGAIALAALVLLSVLLSGRVKIPSLRARQEQRKAYEDPLTQPIQAASRPSPTPAKGKRKTAPRGENGQQPKVPLEAPAYFARFNADGSPSAASPIPLAESEITFGADPVQSQYILDDPSISALQARLKRTAEGDYILYDTGAIAGVWVNYEPITREGHRLAHGDVVHFGQLMFRFYFSNPAPISEPKIEPVPTRE
jgi:hypothetical protein